MEKEPYTNFCGAFVSFKEVMNLQSFEFDASHIIPVNAQNITLLVFFSNFFLVLQRINFLQRFNGIFDHFAGTYRTPGPGWKGPIK